jgi:hypothetical protein
MKKLFAVCLLSAIIVIISASEIGALGCGGSASRSGIFRQRVARDGILSKIKSRESTPIRNIVQKVRELVKNTATAVAGARPRRNQVNFIDVDSSQGRILIRGVSACQGGACPVNARSFEF